jgi:cytochrome b561
VASVSNPSYGAVAKTLHWLIALAIICMLILGWGFDFMPENWPQFALVQLHKSVGITILLLSLLRLVWRLMHATPPLPAHMPAWERTAARVSHILFYTFIILMPMSGWAMVSASPLGLPTVLYGFLPWPHLPILPDLQNKKEISHLMGRMHGLIAYGLTGLLAVHIGATLKHHFIDRDDVLTRMAPRFFNRFLNRLRGMA